MTAEATGYSGPTTTDTRPPLSLVSNDVPVELCRCGHEADAHEHYRPGDDCGVCGSAGCRHFRRRTGQGARLPFRRP